MVLSIRGLQELLPTIYRHFSSGFGITPCIAHQGIMQEMSLQLEGVSDIHLMAHYHKQVGH